MGFKNIISIHGVPRSGTSWLGTIFDSSPNVRYKFQPLFSYAFKDQINLKSTRDEIKRFYMELYDCNDDFLDQKKNIKKNIYPKFTDKNGDENNLVTKMARYHYLIPHLLEQMSNIIFVGIIRNPCAVLNSWRKAPKEYSPSWNFKNEWRFAQSKNRFRPEEYYGFNRWKEATKLFIEMRREYPKRFIIVKYEDLVIDPIAKVKSLFEFCNLIVTNQTLDFIEKSTKRHTDDPYGVFKGKKDIFDWKNELNPKIIQTIESELAGTEFEQFL